MIAAKVRCLDVPSGADFTLNATYSAVSVGVDGSDIRAIIVNDTGTPVVVTVNGAGFEFTEIYAVERVI